MSFPQSIGDFFRPGMMPNPVRAVLSIAAVATIVSAVALAVFGTLSFVAMGVIAACGMVVLTGSIIGSVGMTALGSIGLFGFSFAAVTASSSFCYYTPIYVY